MNRGYSFLSLALGVLALWIGQATFLSAQAQPAGGAISGQVTTLDGQPVADAEVRIVELNRRIRVDDNGQFSFADVPAGSYLLEARSKRLGNSNGRVRVAVGGTAQTALVLDLAVHHDEIVVTASPDPRSQEEVAMATTVLDSEELQQQLQPTLGETLNKQPGISSTFWGPGASSPVIRGLGGDRVRVLESGVGTGDASTTSPDHAVSVDPISAERIEILRGPATLLYGSSAVGGVVNILDHRIPDSVPGERISGNFDGRGGSNAKERSGNLSLTGGGGHFAWHLDGQKRTADDYESAEGTVANSDIDSKGGAVGASYIGSAGYLGVSVNQFKTFYGSPAEEEVKIDLKQRRADLEGELNRSFAFLRGVKVRFGRNDYEHVELEGGETGTRFLNDGWEGRVEALQRRLPALSGSFGLQLSRRDFSAIGEEAFVPRTLTKSQSLFTFQEVGSGTVKTQLGLRYEKETVDAQVTERVRTLLNMVWVAGGGVRARCPPS